MSAAMLSNLIREFGASIGLPELQLDEESRVNLMFDDVATSFELGRTGTSVYIYSYLGEASSTGREAVLSALLDANYLFSQTDGMTLGVEAASGKVVMIREERLESLRLSEFETVVEAFVNAAEQWKGKLTQLAVDAAVEPVQAPQMTGSSAIKV